MKRDGEPPLQRWNQAGNLAHGETAVDPAPMRRGLEPAEGRFGGSFLARRGKPCGGFAPPPRSRRRRETGLNDRDLTIPWQHFLALEGEEAALLVAARYDALRAADCDAEAAFVVAVHPEIAVGDAVALIRRGCTPRTAVRILL